MICQSSQLIHKENTNHPKLQSLGSLSTQRENRTTGIFSDSLSQTSSRQEMPSGPHQEQNTTRYLEQTSLHGKIQQSTLLSNRKSMKEHQEKEDLILSLHSFTGKKYYQIFIDIKTGYSFKCNCPAFLFHNQFLKACKHMKFWDKTIEKFL